MNPLTKSTHTRGGPLVKDTVKTGLTVDVSECRPELLRVLQNSPKHFKLYLMKVVHLVEGHNFHVDWHFKFWVEIGEKLDRLIVPPVHRDRPTFKVGTTFLQNLLRKTLDDLCESYRGSQIYNFCIHHFVHLYSSFERKSRSK
jgi:hypothetical protein